MMMISPSAVHSTEQSSYCWQKATNSSSVMGPRRGFKITGAIDSKSSTTNCMNSVYAAWNPSEQQSQRQLGNARIARGGDLAEGGGPKRRIHAGELRMIEQI